MTQSDGWFKGDITAIGALDIEGPLAAATSPCCQSYISAYSTAEKAARERGDEVAAEVYGFLGAVVSFLLRPEMPRQPYGPWFQMNDRRGLTPGDLTASDLEAVRELAKQAKNPALRARLFDVIWERAKDHLACAQAAVAYLEAGQRLVDDEHWVHALEYLQRGIYLAGLPGISAPLHQRAKDVLLAATREAGSNPRGFFCCRLMELAFLFRIGEPDEFDPMAERNAIDAESAGDFRTARPYWEMAAKWRKRAGNADAERAALLSAAETHISEAETRAAGRDPSGLVAAQFMAQGIEALRRAGGDTARIEQLKKRLAEFQAASLSEMKVHSQEIDISDALEHARNHVSGLPLREALIKLAFGKPLEKYQERRKEVENLAHKHPFTHFASKSIVDDKGRPIVKRDGLLWLKGEEYEDALEQEMFQHAASFEWGMAAVGFIQPARLQIFNDHKPSLNDLLFLVQSNPFVPQGHEAFFLRGIHAGLHGDFIEASHLLVPQIENSIRFVLENRDADVSILNPDGTQRLNMLKWLLKKEETIRIFGEDLCFELRGCLLEKTGFAFRDKLAHGLLKVEECFTVAPIYIWWLVLRLLLTPLMQTMSKEGSTNEESGR